MIEEGGVYSDKGIKKLIERGLICSKEAVNENQIQPSSLDLRLGEMGYCLPFSSISSNGNFEEFLKNNSSYDVDLSKNGFLHKNCVYVFELQEYLKLPPGISGRVNPKSSIGRIDVHVRLIAENGTSFDKIPYGYSGKLWVEIYPRSFDIIVRKGDCLNQLRFFDSNTCCLDEDCLKKINKNYGLLFESNNDTECLLSEGKGLFNGIFSLTLDLDERFPGFVSKENAPPVDLSKRDLPFSEYFDKVYLSKGLGKGLIVNSNSFYILSSKEIISIPANLCSEMVDIETDAGEVRVHYAGFFDPNFRAQATLEVRNFGQPFLLTDGQRIGSFKFYRMKDLPEVLYGEKGKGSHYQGQHGPKLAKYFDMNK